MKTWKTESTSSGERLSSLGWEVFTLEEAFFKGIVCHHYYLCCKLCMTPLTLILKNSTEGYDLAKEYQVNHHLFIDDLKLFRESEDQIDSLYKL